MPEHVLMSEIEIITDGGHRRRWTAAEKLPIADETRHDRANISVVARRIGGAQMLRSAWADTLAPVAGHRSVRGTTDWARLDR